MGVFVTLVAIPCGSQSGSPSGFCPFYQKATAFPQLTRKFVMSGMETEKVKRSQKEVWVN